MQIQVVSSFVDDPSVTTTFAGRTVPASCLLEDVRTGNRWVLFSGSISEHHWAEARGLGAVGVVRPVPLGYIEQTVFSDRADRRGSMTIDDKLFIPCDELPLVPEKQRPLTSFAPFVHLHAHSEFCLAPETLVCTASMVWKKIGDVERGEVLVGFDEDLRPEDGQRGNSRSKMRPSTVIATKRRVHDCYRITLEDGTSIVSSAKHGWVVTGTTRGSLIEPDGPECGFGSNTRRWLTTEHLGVGLPDRWGHTKPTRLPKLVKWATPWGDVPLSLQRDAAYLAGILDGEGWLHDGQLAIAQNPGPVLDEIKRCCEALGYPITDDRVQSNRGECRTFRFAGYETALRVLSQCDPVRFRDRWSEVWEGRRAGGRYTTPVQIVSVEHLGEMETVALTTSTKTFVAEGFLSHNSPLDGLATPQEMVDRAVALDQFAIAVTDHGYCAAHPLLQKAATAAGVKPIFGVEANLVRNRHLREDRYDYWHFLLLARNEVGLRNLWGASSEAHIEGFYGRPRMDFETLARFSEGLIGSTACLRGPLKQLVLAGDEQGAKEMIAKLQAIFPESLYLEIHTNTLPEQIELNKALVQLGKEMSLPLVAVCDAHYAEDCDHHLHKAWIAAQTDKDLSADQDLFSGDEHYYLRSHVEVADSLAYLGHDAAHEAMSNTVEIARSCDVTIKQGSAKPVYHRYVAPGFERASSGAERDIEVLREKCEAGFALKRLAERDAEMIIERDQLKFANRMEEADRIETYRERLERELAAMIEKGFAGYFLIVEDYCLDPSTPVLTNDLRWVEVGKLEVGDGLLAFDENKVTRREKGHRYWRSSDVVSVRRIVLPTYRVVLSDGTETVVSDDHQWLVSSPGGSAQRWIRTRDLRVGQRPQRLVQQWSEPDTWEAGYIAGILDGEGWLTQSEIGNGGTSFTLGFAQREGVVLDAALRILDAWGFDYALKSRSDGVHTVTLRGGRSEVLRLLGTARPQRLLDKVEPELLGRVVAIDQPSIISVESLGLGEVVALETTTGTLVAQGFAHHNCNAARQGRTSANKRLLMGPGRGSVVGSLVAYLLGITQVDPIEADLLFERFITAGRNSPPDIDLDFPSSERPAITEYITHRWGEDRVVRVGTHGRLQNKGVMRSLEKVFRTNAEHAMEWTDLVEITKIIDAAEAHTAGLGLKWDDLWEQEGELLEPYRQKYPQIFDYAERMVKRLKSYGRHASGVVIDPEHPIVDRLPLRTAGDKDDRQVVTEFDMEALELLGYLKFDILTLRTLDTIQVCLDMIEGDEFYGGKLRIDIDAWREEYNDPQVWDMLCSGDTLGVFQIETSSGTRLVKRMQPHSIADLSAILTLVRPGPMRSGLTDTYIKRRFGEEPVVAIHPLLEPVLGRTYQCFAAETEVITRNGTRRIKDLHQSLGEQVMDGNGRWVDADVRWFGQQSLVKISLKRNKQTKDIFATADHRWFARWSDSKSKFVECTTDDLRPGMILRSGMPNGAQNTNLSPVGACAGIVFGDGVCTPHSTYVDLWGDKNIDLLHLFGEQRRASVESDPRCALPKVRVFDMPRSWKSHPSLDEGASFLLGWMAGYFAADGCVSKTGQAVLSSARREDLEWFRTVANVVGIGTYGITKSVTDKAPPGQPLRTATLYQVGLVASSIPDGFFLISEHADRFAASRASRVRADRTQWTVGSVEATERIEDVYCAVIPTTASFVLEDHILTGNCMIYQEDIMAVCSTLAGYDLEQSDKVRAILGKKKVEEAAKEGVKFIDRAVERGVERPLAEAVWAQMQEFAKYCVTGDTRIMLAGAGSHSDGWVSVEDAYRRLHTPMRDPVQGRTKTGEEFSGPCDVCGATESIVWTRGRCNACTQWRKKALAPDRGVFGMAVHPDGRIRKCRLLDVQMAGEQRVVTITLANGMSITATPDHRHLTPNGLRCVDDGLAVGDLLIVNGGYEPDGYTPERDRTTVGGRRAEGVVNAAFGDDNYGYINGGFASLSAWTAQTPKVCAECGHDGSERRIERAHLDGNRQNNDWENLRMLCVSCHKRHDYEHNGRRRRGEKGLLSAESAIVSIEDAGTQVTYDVMMDEPHIWIANGIATTNTFNRAHSWSYAVLAYWCAWLKCHFPAHFAVAVLSTIEKGRIPEFVEMTRRNGYEVLPPDVNESAHGFTVSANRLGVRYGFGSISQIGEATSEAIVQGQPYSSWEDFIERRGSKCNFGHIRTLAGVGTFDALIPEGKTRPALLAMIELLAAGKATTCRWKIEGYDGPNGLPCTFDWSTEVTIGKSGKPLKAKPLPKACTKACRQYSEREGGVPWPELPGLTKKQVRDREREVLGVYLSSTPFDAVPLNVLDDRGIIYGEEFDQAPNGNHGVYAMINSVRLHEDKAGRKMAFVRINSLGYEHDVTVFSTAYQRYGKALVKDTLCIIDLDRNDRGMTMNHIFPIDQEQAAALQPTQEK